MHKLVFLCSVCVSTPLSQGPLALSFYAHVYCHQSVRLQRVCCEERLPAAFYISKCRVARDDKACKALKRAFVLALVCNQNKQLGWEWSLQLFPCQVFVLTPCVDAAVILFALCEYCQQEFAQQARSWLICSCVQSAKMKVQKYSGVRPDPNPIGPPQQPAGPSGPNGTPLGPQGPAGNLSSTPHQSLHAYSVQMLPGAYTVDSRSPSRT